MQISDLAGGFSDLTVGHAFKAFAGSTSVDTLARVLRLTVYSWESFERTQQINPKYVLAEAWNEARLESARSMFANGRSGPPIRVVELKFQGLPTYYDVIDGMHRTVAARLAERRGVEAVICGSWHSDPYHTRVFNHVAWHLEADCWRRWGCERESRSVISLLQKLGVEVKVSCTWKLIERIQTILYMIASA